MNKSVFSSQIGVAKNRRIVATLALIGAFQPMPIPLTFLHKLYLGQYGWSVVYFLLDFTQISRIACAVEGGWYLWGDRWHSLSQGLLGGVKAQQKVAQVEVVNAIATTHLATALRELEQLRREGLLSEGEFEQKRRSLL